MISLNISEYWVKKFHLTEGVPCPCWFLAVSTLWIAEAKILDNINGKLWALLSQRPPPPPGNPREFFFFFLPYRWKIPGGWGSEPVKCRRGRRYRANAPPQHHQICDLMWNAQECSNTDIFNYTCHSFSYLKFPNLKPKTSVLIPYRMNQMRPIAKREKSCTLKAPDLSILEN